MTEAISSFDDFVEVITRKLRQIRHFERCIFSAWCGDLLLSSNAEILKETLGTSGRESLHHILDEIWNHLLAGEIPHTEALHELDNQFMGLEPDDPLADDLHPVAGIVMNAVGLAILGCRRREIDLTAQVAETVLRVLEENSAVSSKQLFSLPEVQEEVKRQLDVIKHLRGEYRLDGSLRVMFRE